MNDESILIILIFLFKIIVLCSLPVYIFIVKEKKSKTITILVLVNIIILSSFIILKLFNNSYIINSSIIGIKNIINSTKYMDKTLTLTEDPNIVKEVVTNKFFNTKNGTKVYYFNNISSPLKDKKVNCDNNYVYFKNVGNNITAVSTFLSSEINNNIDPLQLLDLSMDNDIFDCNNGVETSKLLDLVSKTYNVSIVEISYNEMINYVNLGKIVLAEIENVDNANNLSCGKDNIVIYNLTNDGNFKVLSPNNRDYDYICSDNTPGFGKIINKNTNENDWNPDNIYSIGTKYYIIER